MSQANKNGAVWIDIRSRESSILIEQTNTNPTAPSYSSKNWQIRMIDEYGLTTLLTSMAN